MKHERLDTRGPAERGYTLTEVMVAITISVFLLMGLFTILQQTRRTSSTTTGISQLQDDERVAMTIMTDTLHQAGYVPEPNGAGKSLFVADGVFATAGQVMFAGSGPIGERLTMRYVLGKGDSTLTCAGWPNPGNEQVYKEIFQIDTDPKTGVTSLQCIPSDGNGAVPLVNNVANLTFQFAVNTTSATSITKFNTVGPNTEASNATGFGCPADTYIPTANMSTSDWTNVCAVKVDIVFVNPLYQPAGQPQPTPGQPQYVTFERVIGIQSETGVNVSTVTPPGGA